MMNGNKEKIFFYEKLIKINKKTIEECKDRILFAEENLEKLKIK